MLFSWKERKQVIRTLILIMHAHEHILNSNSKSFTENKYYLLWHCSSRNCEIWNKMNLTMKTNFETRVKWVFRILWFSFEKVFLVAEPYLYICAGKNNISCTNIRYTCLCQLITQEIRYWRPAYKADMVLLCIVLALFMQVIGDSNK